MMKLNFVQKIKFKSRRLHFLLIILTVIIIGVISYFGYKNFSSSALFSKFPYSAASSIAGTYKSDKYGYSFQVPDSFFITKKECKKDGWSGGWGGQCLEAFTITPQSYTQTDATYLALGNITLIRGIKDINFSGQTWRTSYNTKEDKWIVSTPKEKGDTYEIEYKDAPVTTIGNNLVSHTSVGGSQGSTSIQIITNKEKDLIFIVTRPYTNRVRCDMIKDMQEKESCETVRNQPGRIDSSMGDGDWVSQKFYSDTFKDTNKILESFNW